MRSWSPEPSPEPISVKSAVPDPDDVRPWAARPVTLVRPPRLFSRSALTTNVPVPALDLAALAAALRVAGHRPVCIDASGLALDQCTPFDDLPFVVQGLTADEIVDRVPPESLFVGVSCKFSCEWAYHRRVIETLHRRLPHLPIVVGGEHVTADTEAVLRSCPMIAAVALGEGDQTIVDLARAFAGGCSLDGVAGLAMADGNGGVRRTERRERVGALDDLPWPSWDDVPLEPYLSRGFGMDEYGVRAMPMLASRGCPYRCTFCSSPQMWTTKWLARDPADVVREIRHAIARYRIEHVEFYDLTTIIDRRWILRFTELLIEADLGITWTMPSGTRSEALDAEVLAGLRRSGCQGVSYAPESGSPTTLARIKKKVDPERMLASIRAAVKAGLFVKVHLIVGLPDQTRREVWESFRFMLRLLWAGAHDVLVYPFNAYPGSEIYSRLVASGRVDPRAPDYDRFLLGADYGDFGEAQSWSQHLSLRAVQRVSTTSMLIFYGGQYVLRPWRAVATLFRLTADRPRTWFQRALTSLGRRLAGRFVPAAGPGTAAVVEATSPSGTLPVAFPVDVIAADTSEFVADAAADGAAAPASAGADAAWERMVGGLVGLLAASELVAAAAVLAL